MALRLMGSVRQGSLEEEEVGAPLELEDRSEGNWQGKLLPGELVEGSPAEFAHAA